MGEHWLPTDTWGQLLSLFVSTILAGVTQFKVSMRLCEATTGKLKCSIIHLLHKIIDDGMVVVRWWNGCEVYKIEPPPTLCLSPHSHCA